MELILDIIWGNFWNFWFPTVKDVNCGSHIAGVSGSAGPLFIHSFIFKNVTTGGSLALGAWSACPHVGHAAVNVLVVCKFLRCTSVLLSYKFMWASSNISHFYTAFGYKNTKIYYKNVFQMAKKLDIRIKLHWTPRYTRIPLWSIKQSFDGLLSSFNRKDWKGFT